VAVAGWQMFCSNFLSNTLFMELLNTPNLFADRVNEFSFLMGIIITVLFYFEYKKCIVQIEKEDMLDKFLND
jgi:hypothetical protein